MEIQILNISKPKNKEQEAWEGYKRNQLIVTLAPDRLISSPGSAKY